MKTKKLYLLRHAKSSWKDFSIRDFDRPLNKRGKHDAPMMAKRMAKRGIKPDIILSSPAKRAKATSKQFSEKLGTKILYHDSIYESSATRLKEIIKDAFETYDSVMLVGHNPSMTVLSNALSDYHIDNIPTCGIVGFVFEEGAVENGKAALLFFDYPKNTTANDIQ
jgi:phosphohistidine phosphatase